MQVTNRAGHRRLTPRVCSESRLAWSTDGQTGPIFMKILVTGAAGFIGYHLSECLLARGDVVVGLDNLNDYYDVSLKEARLARLCGHANFRFVGCDLADRASIDALFAQHVFTHVVNLAAQAGVRYSAENPHLYASSNMVGFLNILEGCRRHGIEHLVYASSSSVYGGSTQRPFSVSDRVDQPLSFYAATKRSNELMAHTYSHLYRLPVTGLRFFTVYGPWGRPDMALFSFTREILAGRPIAVFNYGHHRRDFTYIDDTIDGVCSVLNHVPAISDHHSQEQPDASSHLAPYRLYNIGNSQPVALMDYIQILEEVLGKKAKLNLLPLQPGDVEETYAHIDPLQQAVGFLPKTSVREGIERFVAWYRAYYAI